MKNEEKLKYNVKLYKQTLLFFMADYTIMGTRVIMIEDKTEKFEEAWSHCKGLCFFVV